MLHLLSLAGLGEEAVEMVDLQLHTKMSISSLSEGLHTWGKLHTKHTILLQLYYYTIMHVLHILEVSYWILCKQIATIYIYQIDNASFIYHDIMHGCYYSRCEWMHGWPQILYSLSGCVWVCCCGPHPGQVRQPPVVTMHTCAGRGGEQMRGRAKLNNITQHYL